MLQNAQKKSLKMQNSDDFVPNEFAPAKINLALHIVGQTLDGYHKLESLVVFARIGDNLQISPAKKNSFKISGEFASSLNNSKDNLVLKAISAYKKHFPNKIPSNLKIHLEKNLPIASGIGGGSADCAATLRLLNKLNNKEFSAQKLEEIALSLGADVPMCLSSKPAIIKNIGEIIEPIKNFPNAYIILINPNIKISTQQIFNDLKNKNNAPLPPTNNGFKNIKTLSTWLKNTRNDLLPPIIKTTPIISEVIDEFNKNKNCLHSNMSGSGATVFALYESLNDAKNAATNISKKYPHFWVKHAPLMSNIY